MVTGPRGDTSGLGGGLSLLSPLVLSDTGTADPLAVEPDLARDLTDRLLCREGGEDFCGELLASRLLRFHGASVGAAEGAQTLPALVIHADMVPQGTRHHLVAYVHGHKYDTG